MFQCLWSGNLLYCFYKHPPTLLFESIIGWFSVWKASLHLPELTNSHQWGSYKRKKLFWQTCQERLIRSTMCTQSKYNWGEELASIWLPFHSTRLSTKINKLNKQINLQVAVNFGQCNRSVILLSCVHTTLSPGKNKQTKCTDNNAGASVSQGCFVLQFFLTQNRRIEKCCMNRDSFTSFKYIFKKKIPTENSAK